MRWVQIDQNTDEWLALRAGKVGGSSIGKVMANYGKAFGQPAHDLAVKIAIERITGQPINENYTNAHMERGHREEPVARALYEEFSFCDVRDGGYFTDDDFIGSSPDGLVGVDGLIEIKSVIYTTQFTTVDKASYDSTYKWQLLYNLMASERDWIDFVSYCSQFPQDNQLFCYRVFASDVDDGFAMILKRMDEFKKLVEEKIKTIKGKK